MTKNEIIAKLEELEVEFDASAKKAELEEILKNSLSQEKKKGVDKFYGGVRLINNFWTTSDNKKFRDVHKAAEHAATLL